MTLLLVDNDERLRQLCAAFLAQSGFEVLAADNGLEALLLALDRKGAVDLVITDLTMPQISGAELGRVFKQIWPSMSVLYMSGTPRETFGEDLPANCTFLRKPFAPDELLSAIASVLQGGVQPVVNWVPAAGTSTEFCGSLKS